MNADRKAFVASLVAEMNAEQELHVAETLELQAQARPLVECSECGYTYCEYDYQH